MLKQQIQSDATVALKSGNSEVVGVLRLISSSLNTKEKEKRYNLLKEKPDLKEEIAKESELTDEEAVSVLSSEVKKRRDAIALYEKGGRPELAEKEKKEIEIIQKYLPEQLPSAELEKMIKEAIEKTGAKEMKDMGKVMAELAPKVKGRADNSEVSKMVKEILK